MKRGSSIKNDTNSQGSDWRNTILQYAEKVLFFIVASAVWCIIVSYSLEMVQFPVHLHRIEVSCIYVVPIGCIFAIMKCIDYFVPT